MEKYRIYVRSDTEWELVDSYDDYIQALRAKAELEAQDNKFGDGRAYKLVVRGEKI